MIVDYRAKAFVFPWFEIHSFLCAVNRFYPLCCLLQYAQATD